MAEDTMRRVNEAEAQAQQRIQEANAQSEAALASAAEQGKKIIADAVKEAHKKADVLYGVARADAGKIRSGAQAETDEKLEALRAGALSRREQASKAILEIVLSEA